MSLITSAKGGGYVTAGTDLEGEKLTPPPPHLPCCWCAASSPTHPPNKQGNRTYLTQYFACMEARLCKSVLTSLSQLAVSSWSIGRSSLQA